MLLISIWVCIIPSIFLAVGKNMFLVVIIYFFVYSMGLGSIVWFIVPEMFPDEYETAGMAVSTVFNWVAFIISITSFPFLFDFLRRRIFILSTFWMVVLFFLILFLLTETRDRVRKFQIRWQVLYIQPNHLMGCSGRCAHVIIRLLKLNHRWIIKIQNLWTF